MKKIFEVSKKIAAPICLAALFAFSVKAQAQPTPVSPVSYPLLSSTPSNQALTNGQTVTINGPTFPIWRGRGFSYSASCIATDATTANLTFTFQFATVHTNSAYGTKTTNWNTANKLTSTVALNGATRVYFITNVPNTIVDNYTLGRLQSIANAHTNTTSVDGTNTVASAIP